MTKRRLLIVLLVLAVVGAAFGAGRVTGGSSEPQPPAKVQTREKPPEDPWAPKDPWVSPEGEDPWEDDGGW